MYLHTFLWWCNSFIIHHFISIILDDYFSDFSVLTHFNRDSRAYQHFIILFLFWCNLRFSANTGLYTLISFLRSLTFIIINFWKTYPPNAKMPKSMRFLLQSSIIVRLRPFRTAPHLSNFRMFSLLREFNDS